MQPSIFEGAGVALITPMDKKGNIHYEKLEELIEYQVTHKSDALIVAGTTGEAATLTEAEYRELIHFTVNRIRHRMPVIAGAGSNNTRHAMELSKIAESAGTDALLHVTPYYNKTSQRGLVKHFEACAAASSLPIILYNVPSRTGVNIQPETYIELCRNEKIRAVKEASGDFKQMVEIMTLCGDRLDIYTGNDDQLTCALALGAKGVISVLSNVVPEVVHDICEKFFLNQPVEGHVLMREYLPLVEALFLDVNPIAVKQAMNFMGLEVGECRLPLCEMEPQKARQLLNVLDKYDLVKHLERKVV